MIHKTNIFAAPIICGAALALALAAGCDKMATTESPTGFPEDGVVRIAANAGDPLTRADGTSSSEYSGTTLGLFIDYGQGDKYNGSNVKWTKAENAWTPEKQMLWKSSTDAAQVYAYAPYVEGQTDPTKVEFSIPADQSQGTLTADLVSWAYLNFVPNSSNNNFQDGKILISFGHRLVKLTFNFEKGNQFADGVTVSEAVLLGTSSKVVLNATAGTVAAASDAASLDIKLHQVKDAQNPNALKYEAVFFPGEGQKAGVKMLKVTMSEGTVLNYVVPSDGLVSGGLKAGSAYEMKMRLGKDKIELAKDGITVGSWTDVEDPLPGGEAQLNGNSWDGTIATGFEGGDGSSNDPYIIATASQLAYLAQQVNGGTSYEGKYFRQTANFDLAGKKWTPIGNFPNEFKGHFDGDNKEVYDLNVDITGSYAGLFGNIRNGSVKNVRICSGSVKASVHYVGGIVGDFNYSTMENCTASVNVSGNSNVGGLAGNISGSTVSNCHFLSGEIVGSGDGNWDGEYVGGIVGHVQSSNVSTVKDCSANASVKGKMNVGGLCGWFGNGDHEFSNCTMKGSVTVTKEWCGGLVGYLSSSNGKFENCQFEGSIKKDGDDVSATGIAIGADASNVTFKNCVCTIDEQTKTSLGGEKVGKARSDNYEYSDTDIKVIVK